MTTESIIAIAALAFLAGSIAWLIHIGQRDAELIFEADYDALKRFIHECEINEVNEAKIVLRLNEMINRPEANKEKLQVLNREFRLRFSVSLSDVVCHEACEQ